MNRYFGRFFYWSKINNQGKQSLSANCSKIHCARRKAQIFIPVLAGKTTKNHIFMIDIAAAAVWLNFHIQCRFTKSLNPLKQAIINAE